MPDQAPVAFNKREFVRQAAFKQYSDSIVPGYIRCRNQGDVFSNAEVGQMRGLHQNEEVPGDRVLYLREFLAKVLDKDFLDTRSQP